ncbi:SCO family protein [Ottowia sp. GY511]|uniref:SCO family protein n=1 Tax=Ottowia flava TaxID=2675430 RepID=A0ABW4KPT2_9BURK|nr:SCO family protein [Ottowia sp. GY511]TXK32847.1 SCO family protein [Ottowia sp. GY511]
MRRRNALKSVAACAVVAGASGLLAACDPSKPQFYAIDITGADYAKDFQLTDFDGKPRTLADFKGKVVVLFFGFTQCPDVCPTTMTELAQVKQSLGADGDKVQGLFVSIDPERDTPAVLKEYMRNFDPTFLGLYAGSPEKLAALAKDFKVYYKKVDGKTPTSYTMDHTAASFIYDPQGRLRLYARYGMGAQPLANDIKLLIQGN